MLIIIHYRLLSSHVESAHNNLDAIIKKECVRNDEKLMDLMIEYKKNLQEILDFLVVKKVEDNK